MIPSLSILAFAALDESTLRKNFSEIRAVFLPMVQRGLPSITNWRPEQGLFYSYVSDVQLVMKQLVRLDVCESFLASRVHKDLKELRQMEPMYDDHDGNAEIKRHIRSMQIFHTLGGRQLLAKMAQPSYYAKLRPADTYKARYEFLICKSHRDHLCALADIGATSFSYDEANECFTVCDEDIDRHIVKLRVDVAPSRRQRYIS